MLVDLHVIVDAGAALFPVREDVLRSWKRFERGPLDLLKQRTAAGSEMARDAVIDLLDAVADSGVEFGEREERALTELRDDPSGCDLYSHLYLSFVSGLFGTGRDYCGVVVVRHLLIRTIDVRLVEAGFGDPRFKIVTDRHRRDTAKVAKGAFVRADPIGKRLRPGCFRVRQRRSAENRDEQLGREDLAGGRGNDLQLCARVIDEHALAGDMRLAHRRREPLLPVPVQVAKARIRVPPWMLLAILLPEQLQRNAGALQFAMDLRPIW